jgi:hypothetical protein
MDGDKIISGIERVFVAWVQCLLSLVIKFYRPPRSFFGSIGYEAKHLTVLASVAWFLDKLFGPLAMVVWVGGSFFMDWILKKYSTQ